MMKRRCIAILFLTVVCAFLCGCGKDEGDKEASVPETTGSDISDISQGSEPLLLESNTPEHSIIEFSIEENMPFDTLEEFIESEAGKKIISSLTKNDEEGVFSSRAYAEGNNFVLERRFSKDFNLWLEEDFLKNIKENVESKSDVFISVVDELEGCIDQRNITFCVRYTDPEGNVLYEKKFDNSKLKNKPKDTSSVESSGQASSETSAVSSVSAVSFATSAA